MTDDAKTLKIALLGCGSVGSQVARLLREQADDLAAAHRGPARAGRHRGPPARPAAPGHARPSC